MGTQRACQDYMLNNDYRHIRLYPGTWIVAGILLVFVAHGVWAWMHSGRQINGLAQQLSSMNIIQKPPMANHPGTLLGVIRTTEHGEGIFIEDITNKTERKLREATDVNYMASRDWVFGWSPDDATLAYSWDYTLNFVKTVGPGTDGSIDGISNRIKSFAWITPTSCAFIDERPRLVLVRFMGGKWKETASWKLLGNNGPLESLQAVGTNVVVWHTWNYLWRADLSSGKVQRLYSSGAPTIESLSYSKDTGEFLLVEQAHHARTSSLVALSIGSGGQSKNVLEDKSLITSAQWINHGQGYACIVQGANNNYLTVKSDGIAPEQTLFTNGQVWSIFCDGNSPRVYALADKSSEPAAIWQCNANSGHINCAVSPWGNRDLHFHFLPVSTEWAHWKEAGRTHAAEFDLVSPANFSKHKKYPLIIGTGAYEWTPIPHGIYAQCLAKSGVYVALVNYHWSHTMAGVDFYTNHVLAVYNQLAKNPNIDKSRVFLFGFSAGTEVVRQLVKDYPGRWRGIMLLNPSPLPEAEAGMTGRVLATAGSGEDEQNRFRRYQKELFKAGIPMDWHIHENSQHVERDKEDMYERTIWMAKMIFNE